jgi:hypothetical protein
MRKTKVKKSKKNSSRKNKRVNCKKGAITDEVIRIRGLITKLKNTKKNRKDSTSTSGRTEAI